MSSVWRRKKLFFITQLPSSPQQQLGCIQPAWAAVVKEPLNSPESERGNFGLNIHQPLPPFSHRQVECGWPTQCWPDQKKSMMALWTSSIRPFGGVRAMSWCQSVEATNLLATRTLPLYNSWGSNHFHLDNRAHTFSFTPSQSYFTNPSEAKNTPSTFSSFFPHSSPPGNLGTAQPLHCPANKVFTLGPVYLCWCGPFVQRQGIL